MNLELPSPAAELDPTPVLDLLLAAGEPSAPADLEGWWIRHVRAVSGYRLPVDRTIAATSQLDRLAYVVASAYIEALHQLIPRIGTAKVALCATEGRGAHPRAIETRLEPDGSGWRLSGEKAFVTLGAHADELLVVATTGDGPDGRPRLRLADVPARRVGVTLEPLAATPFAPELPHARARFAAVRVEPDELLPGDGYSRYLKPFRTVEDVHVHAALLAFLVGVARRSGWARSVQQELLALLVAARGLAGMNPSDRTCHLALAGLITRTRLLLEESRDEWTCVEPELRARWERDRPLLDVASSARAARLEAAWRDA